ncbi:Glycosyltransferase 2-like [Bartonella apihabitans]|uniref:glycosyltransferase family 2 protein n=1 Tax=Bartonella apihabitans TaxID=2750929 RepID=UPI003997EC46
MENKPRILVFIPAYRCAPQIGRVLSQFDDEVQKWVDTVMVVDNRSPDDTQDKAIASGRDQLDHCRFIVWENADNYGLGGSHKVAFQYAIQHGYDYLVVLHGDDQADIRDLLPFLKQGIHLENDCLLGARFMTESKLEGYSAFRTFGNRVYNWLFSMVAFHRIYDLGSGLNVYRLDKFKEFYYKKFPDDLTFNYVMLLGSYNKGQKVRFFPITWRESDQVSNVQLFRQAFKVLQLLGKYFFMRGRFLKSEMRTVRHASYTGKIVFTTQKDEDNQ